MPTAFSLLPLFQFTYLFIVYPPACAMGQCLSNTGLQPSLCPVSCNFLCGWIFHSKLLTLSSRECFFLWIQSFVLNVLAKHWSLPLHQASVSALCQALLWPQHPTFCDSVKLQACPGPNTVAMNKGDTPNFLWVLFLSPW